MAKKVLFSERTFFLLPGKNGHDYNFNLKKLFFFYFTKL